MKVSEIISKQGLCLFENQLNIVIYKPVFSLDLKKIKGFVVFDIEEKEYFLPLTSVHSFGDVFVVKNSGVLKEYIEIDSDIIGKKVYDTDGRDLGFLVDIEFSLSGDIEYFMTTKKTIEKLNILSIGNNIIVHGEKKLPKSLKPKLLEVKTENSSKVNILENTIVPTTVAGNTSILIGRKMTKDIISKNYEVIARKDQVINEKILIVAKKHNKVNQLFINSI